MTRNEAQIKIEQIEAFNKIIENLDDFYYSALIFENEDNRLEQIVKSLEEIAEERTIDLRKQIQQIVKK